MEEYSIVFVDDGARCGDRREGASRRGFGFSSVFCLLGYYRSRLHARLFLFSVFFQNDV